MPPDCPVVSQDLTDPEFVRDPHPVLEQWRALAPVVYNAWQERYVVLSYRDCARVLTKLEAFDSQPGAEMFRQVFGGLTMEAYDSPRHHEVRGMWAGDFQRATLEGLRAHVEQVVRSRVDPFVERLRAGEVLDAVTGMTRDVPTLVIAHLLGIDPDMIERFSAWSDAIGAAGGAHVPDPTPEQRAQQQAGAAATRALGAHMAEVVAQRRRDGGRGSDLVSAMVRSPVAATMPEEEIVANATQLVFAGNETTAKLLASTVVALAEHPEQRRAVAADRSLVPRAVEEVHRWATVVNTNPRWANSEDSEVGGTRIPAGQPITPLVAAANRDPARWEDPARFDVQRPVRSHLGFGFGIHRCLGLHLTRLEAAVWLERLLDLLPDFALAGPVDHGRNFSLRGPQTVPVRAA